MQTKFYHRYVLPAVAWVLLVLPACSSTITPDLPEKPEIVPPKASGSLLNSQLRVAISPDFPPLAQKSSLGAPVGLEIDFANQIGRELGKKIVFIEAPWSELLSLLLTRQADIVMSGMSITRERSELVSFTDPYAEIGQMALVRATDASSFSSPRALTTTTAKVGFVRQTTGEWAARSIFLRANLIAQSTIDQGITALRRRDIDVFIHDAPTVWRTAGSPSEKELKGLFWPLTKEHLAWAVRKEDEPLRFALSRIVNQWRGNGQLQLFIKRWVTFTIWQN